eukprot:Nitzschia sp. Nitz4//scaffold96_size78090//66324//67524//NITZ4_005505-RA/size78090-augustus-gene-0.17-mRNA-1//-1//CDS//3329560606//5718//frame0
MKTAVVFLALLAQATAFVPALLAPRGLTTSLNAGSNANVMMPMQKGSTVALITPFTDDGKIDVPGLEKLVNLHLEAGTDNLCVLGTTAEAAVMTMEERALVLNTVVKIAKGKVPLLIGTGTINPNSVKAMTQQAIDLGGDANLVVNPYYVKPPQRALVKHFTEIADMGMPVILYNVPGRTGSNILDETIAFLADHKNIHGVKDATGDVGRLASLKKLLGARDASFLKYSGDDETTEDFVLQGGDGCISVTANIAPKQVHDMVQAGLKGDAALCSKLNAPLKMLHSKLFVESNPIPCKWSAKKLGLINSDYCRPPLDVMDPQYDSVLTEALTAAKLA